jgi:hypothetical protein
MKRTRIAATLLASLAVVAVGCTTGMGHEPMSFFVTSTGKGNGANLGGLAGADAHCQALAQAAGSKRTNWRAYLSTQSTAWNDPNFVNARDRIGTGPWYNAKGVRIAENVDDLHSANAKLTKETLLDEKGQAVNGRTDKPNKHDILTGSRPDGSAHPGGYGDLTCGNWTKGGKEGAAMVGHHDRGSAFVSSWGTSWNSSHPTVGCDQDSLPKTGGAGLFYCFAAN